MISTPTGAAVRSKRPSGGETAQVGGVGVAKPLWTEWLLRQSRRAAPVALYAVVLHNVPHEFVEYSPRVLERPRLLALGEIRYYRRIVFRHGLREHP